MADDPIPKSDSEFHEAQHQLIENVVTNPGRYGLTDKDVTSLQAGQAKWLTAYPAHVAARQGAVTATQTKRLARSGLERVMRSAIRKINASAGDDNAIRAEVGIPPRESARGSIGAPATRPLGRIETNGTRTFVLHFVDSATPQKLAKPRRVHACQVWRCIGDKPPADPSGYVYLGVGTRTPYTDELDASDAGKTAFYLLRWQNARGVAGPWSEVVSAKIPG